MKRWTHRVLLAGVALAALVGCLPVELDVSKDGKVLIARGEGFFVLDPAAGKAERVFGPAGGQPVFARFAPDGKSIVAVVGAQGGGMGEAFQVLLASPGGGAPKALVSASNITYLCVSPNGKHVSLTRLAEQKKPPFEDNTPELILVETATGKAVVVDAVPCVAPVHRWLPDSSAVLVFKLDAKLGDKNQYRGTLTAVDAATGKTKALAAGVGGQEMFLDVSPDGKTALVAAPGVAAAGAQPGAEEAPGLYEVTLASGAVRKVKQNVKFAVWSPKGTKVLVGVPGENEQLALEVADAKLAAFKPVAADAAGQAGGGMGPGAVAIYPSWLDDDRVLYLASQSVYGTAGKNLQLVVVGADGSGRRNLQAVIDAEAAKVGGN